MTRIVIAPDSFKGSIGAAAAAAALADGWRSARPGDDVLLRPMADGGEGTLDAFAAAVPTARRMPVTVSGPHGRPVAASWLLIRDDEGDTGVVELASTSGIELLGAAREPWDAGTRGFGEAIGAALDHGVTRLVLGIGSSASTDGGAGVLTALGGRISDGAGAPIAAGLRGLATAASVDLSALRPLPSRGVSVLSDVTNPLLGDRGAAAVFGPQKGLDAADIAPAEAALARFAALVAADPTTRGRGAPDPAAPASGAAGGTAFGLRAWGAHLAPGAAEVAALIGLADAVTGAALVVTGEGSFDGQSAAGKVPTFVAQTARAAGVPVSLVAGRIARGVETGEFGASVSLVELAGSAAESMADPARWLRAAGAALARAAA